MSDDYRQQLNQVAWSLCILSICTVSARCYCRAWVLRRFGWDDGFMVLALVSQPSLLLNSTNTDRLWAFVWPYWYQLV